MFAIIFNSPGGMKFGVSSHEGCLALMPIKAVGDGFGKGLNVSVFENATEAQKHLDELFRVKPEDVKFTRDMFEIVQVKALT